MALAGRTAATQSSAPPARPRRQAARSTPGRATRTGRGQRVELKQPVRRAHRLVVTTASAAPRTAHSLRAGAPRRPPWPRRGAGARARPASVGRLGNQHLGRRRGDQAVDQHDRAVGEPGDDPGESPLAAAPGQGQEPGRRAPPPTSRRRPARRRPGGRRRCPRWAGPGRRGRPGPRRAPCSQRALVARPGDVRLVQRHGETVEPGGSPSAPACTRSASRSAITRASTSVVVFLPARAGSSSRLR